MLLKRMLVVLHERLMGGKRGGEKTPGRVKEAAASNSRVGYYIAERVNCRGRASCHKLSLSQLDRCPRTLG